MNNGENFGAGVRRDATAEDPATLERRSDAIRADMGQTLDALQRNYSPGRLLDRSLDLFKEHGGELGTNLGRSVKQNPMPVLLTMVGVGWMIWSQTRQQSGAAYGAADDERYEGYGATAYAGTSYGADATTAGASADGGGTGSAVKEKLGAAGEKLRGAKDSALESVRGGAGRVSEGSRRAAARAREQSRRAGQGFQTMLEEQPLVVGALGVALGAIIGAVLPESEREDRMLGEARDRVLDRAKDLGTRGYEQVRDKAQQAAAGVRDAVQADGGADESDGASRDRGMQGSTGLQGGGSDVGTAGATPGGSNGTTSPSARPGL